MVYLDLFFGFLKVGCFSFGGYAAIPLIREVVLGYGWLNDETLSYMIAVSESTPGPIMINLATYVGSSQAGFFGSVVATLATVLPAFFIILLIAASMNAWMNNRYVQAAMKGIEPCVIGIIMATGAYLIFSNCISMKIYMAYNIKSIVVTGLLGVIFYGYRFRKKQKMSPIMLIVISACLGMIVF